MAFQPAGEAGWFLLPWEHGRILRVQWVANSSGAVEQFCPHELNGEPYELVSNHADSARSGTYTLYLYDSLKRDLLNGNGVTLTVNSSSTKTLFQVMTSSVQGRGLLIHPGPLRLVMSNTDGATTWGTFDLYLRERRGSE